MPGKLGHEEQQCNLLVWLGMSKRGAFIVVEGCDRSGKSTQCARLVERLEKHGHRAQLIKFPGNSRNEDLGAQSCHKRKEGSDPDMAAYIYMYIYRSHDTDRPNDRQLFKTF